MSGTVANWTGRGGTYVTMGGGHAWSSEGRFGEVEWIEPVGPTNPLTDELSDDSMMQWIEAVILSPQSLAIEN